jgi:hypothetical protein
MEEYFGFKPFEIPFESKTIKFYISSKNSDFTVKKPIFVNISGFGAFPVFRKTDLGVSSSLLVSHKLLNEKYYYVVIPYPTIPFYSDVEVEPSSTYLESANLNYFSKINSAVIDYLVKQEWIDNKKIIISGASSGSDIATKVATINKNVSHLACFAGCGLTQMYNFIVDIRKQIRTNEISEKDGQKEIIELYSSFKDIFDDPTSVNKFWGGHTFKLWHSFFSNPPLNNLLKVNIPIYYSKGTEDVNSCIEGTDIIPLEFIRSKKNNLTYKAWFGCDHYFQKKLLDSQGNDKVISLVNDVVDDFILWLDNQNP